MTTQHILEAIATTKVEFHGRRLDTVIKREISPEKLASFLAEHVVTKSEDKDVTDEFASLKESTRIMNEYCKAQMIGRTDIEIYSFKAGYLKAIELMEEITNIEE